MSENQSSIVAFHPNVKDLTGQTFGYLSVIRRAHKDIHRNIHWLCRCECGTEKPVNGMSLRQGKIKSCGCKMGAMVSASKMVHGATGSRDGSRVICRTYSIWQNMCARAASNETLEARRYAKRDIPICKRWETYQNFVEDMGHPPSDKHTIDREDNDLGYFKENCRWATQTDQQRNKSSNRIVEFQGKKMCVAEFAERIGMPYRVVADRIRAGWTLDRIVHTPPKTK